MRLSFYFLLLFIGITFSCRIFQITFWHEQLEPSQESQKCDYWTRLHDSSTGEIKERASEKKAKWCK